MKKKTKAKVTTAPKATDDLIALVNATIEMCEWHNELSARMDAERKALMEKLKAAILKATVPPLKQAIDAQLARHDLTPAEASRLIGRHKDFIRNIQRDVSKAPNAASLHALEVLFGLKHGTLTALVPVAKSTKPRRPRAKPGDPPRKRGRPYKDPTPITPLGIRITEGLARMDMKAQTASLKLGAGKDFVRNILRGKSDSPHAGLLAQLERLLDFAPGELAALIAPRKPPTR